MEKRDVYSVIEEVLELDEGMIKGGEALDQFAWESISIVSFIALVDEEFEIVLSAEDLLKCKTIDELAGLVLKNSET